MDWTAPASQPRQCQTQYAAPDSRPRSSWSRPRYRTRRSPDHARSATRSSTSRIALHAARIGGCLAALAVLRGGGQAPFRPVRPDFELVAALLQFLLRRLRYAAFDHHDPRARGARPERGEEVLGVPGGRVDR